MNVEMFYQILQKNKLSKYTGVPCSYFKQLINFIDDRPEVENYICSSEGEAMGIAGGLALSGHIPVVYMQNDGYGNVVNPLSSLQLMYKLPALLLISWRAEPGQKDAPQHILMGETIQEHLSVLNIPTIILDGDVEELNKALNQAVSHFENKATPYAFIIRKGYFDPYKKLNLNEQQNQHARHEYIQLLGEHAGEDDVLLGATGFSGRELHQTVEHAGKFYMMGSMGCLASIGLGIAKQHSQKTIYVLDGDGALLMKMGTLSTVGYYKPQNLFHICFDNHAYESTGGQKTTSNTVNFGDAAMACGYKQAITIESPEAFQDFLKNINTHKRPCFVYIKVKQGTIEGLGRPTESPEEMRTSFMEFLNG